jgi:hypothetical protein
VAAALGGVAAAAAPVLAPATAPTSAPVDERVAVDHQPPTWKRVDFEPGKVPDGVKITAGEAAVTRFDFQCGAFFQWAIERSARERGEWVVSVRPTHVRVKLTLENTLFLPTNATPKLEAHEQGHRTINDAVYQQAAAVARQEAARVLGRSWTGTGATEDDAVKAAGRAALEDFCAAYHRQISDKAYRVGQLYDEITDHGRLPIKEATAIDRAFAAWEKEQR